MGFVLMPGRRGPELRWLHDRVLEPRMSFRPEQLLSNAQRGLSELGLRQLGSELLRIQDLRKDRWPRRFVRSCHVEKRALLPPSPLLEESVKNCAEPSNLIVRGDSIQRDKPLRMKRSDLRGAEVDHRGRGAYRCSKRLRPAYSSTESYARMAADFVGDRPGVSEEPRSGTRRSSLTARRRDRS